LAKEAAISQKETGNGKTGDELYFPSRKNHYFSIKEYFQNGPTAPPESAP